MHIANTFNDNHTLQYYLPWAPEYEGMMSTGAGALMSQSLAVASADAETKRDPGAQTANAKTVPECPESARTVAAEDDLRRRQLVPLLQPPITVTEANIPARSTSIT